LAFMDGNSPGQLDRILLEGTGNLGLNPAVYLVIFILNFFPL